MPLSLQFTTLYEYGILTSGIALPVALRAAGRFADLIAKVDTGATHCIFQRKYGEDLGLAIESGEYRSFETATGSFDAYGHEVTLEVLNLETTSVVFFAASETFGRNVLGRQGWLDRVQLGLVDYEPA